MPIPPSITIEAVAGPAPEVRQLIELLDEELASNYPSEQRHGLSIDAIFQPNIRFFIAKVNGVASGCGGVALNETFAELKRMYVRPEARGAGVADAIMTALVHEAKSAGLDLLRLETGSQQHAALRFYERCGFRRCGAFEPYASMPLHRIAESVFMEKII